MSEEFEAARPIIIKRVKRNKATSHGGSWKVAFADFATAMMAFFLLLWITGNATDQEKQAISGYFVDPTAPAVGASPSLVGDGGANAAVIDMGAVVPDISGTNDNLSKSSQTESENSSPPQELSESDIKRIAEEKELERLRELKLELEALVENTQAFRQFKDQVMIDITPAGLRIQIVDKDKRPMFDSGSAEPKNYSQAILLKLASVLKQVPNKLSITGHTDATPYVERDDYGNWELSSDRANAARRALLRGGIASQQIARVEGFSSSILFDKSEPFNPINRRIAIIVLKRSAALRIEQQVRGIE